MNEHVEHGEKKGANVDWSRIGIIIGVCIVLLGVVKWFRSNGSHDHPSPLVASAPAGSLAQATSPSATRPAPVTTVVDVPASDSGSYSAIVDVPKDRTLCREPMNVDMKYRPVGSTDSDPDHFVAMDQMDRVYADAYVFKAKSGTGFKMKTCQVAFGDECPTTCPDPK